MVNYMWNLKVVLRIKIGFFSFLVDIVIYTFVSFCLLDFFLFFEKQKLLNNEGFIRVGDNFSTW